MRKLIYLVILGVIAFGIFSWGTSYYNNFVTLDEGVNQSWAQVENVYQRRYDLIPNLVETVKGYAKQEKEVLTQVTEARSKMGGVVNVGPEILNDPAAMQQYQQMQGSLGSALQRLMVVVENYPELKSDKLFQDLQTQLEGTENRISVERRRFNESVQNYNGTIRRFPASLIASITGFSQKAYFQMDPAAEKAPQVQF